MKMNLVATISVVAMIAILVGCKNSQETFEKQETIKNTIPPGNWTLTKMGSVPVNEADYKNGSPTIVFKDSSSFSGSTGCNQYMATYKYSADAIAIKMGPLTKMFCPGDSEQNFLKAINQTNRAEMNDNILIFYENADTLMTFNRSK